MIKIKNQDKGFTLVELLIVIVILGILATVTVFAVSGISDTGQNTACDADERTMNTAFEAYFAQNSAHATQESDIVPSFMNSAPAAYTITYGDAATRPSFAATAGGVCA